MEIKLNQKFSNKQKLIFKIINIIDINFYDIQFEIDNLILKNQFHNNIKFGDCFHPDKTKYKIHTRLTKFYHNAKEDALKIFIKN